MKDYRLGEKRGTEDVWCVWVEFDLKERLSIYYLETFFGQQWRSCVFRGEESVSGPNS